MSTKIDAFMIRATTGCSCCREENQVRGPWRTLDGAREAKAAYARARLLSSQYAPNGCYEIFKVPAELLPDGRLVLDELIVAKGFIGETKEDISFEPLLIGNDQCYMIDGDTIKDEQERAA